MARVLALLYGVACYLAFLGVFLYSIAFVANLGVPKSIDTGAAAPPLVALLIDAALLALFDVQHSVMARQWFKRAWARVVPDVVERSTYVLAASAVLALMLWQWRPLPAVVWNVSAPAGRWALMGLFFAGWGVLLLSSCLIDHCELFGLRQVFRYARGEKHVPPEFKQLSLYKVVRHPLYFGFLVGLWATPRMSAGHLFFALMATGYILVGIQFEERDLLRFHGDAYRSYRQRVSMLIPLPRRKA